PPHRHPTHTPPPVRLAQPGSRRTASAYARRYFKTSARGEGSRANRGLQRGPSPSKKGLYETLRSGKPPAKPRCDLPLRVIGDPKQKETTCTITTQRTQHATRSPAPPPSRARRHLADAGFVACSAGALR